MKKKFLSVLLVLAMLSSITASATATPRWSYVSTVYCLIDMQNDAIKWGGSAVTYYFTDVTATKCTATLQAANSFGWYMVDSDTTMLPGNEATASGNYSSWKAGTSYRVKVEAWAYIGNTVVESVGPFYEYYNA